MRQIEFLDSWISPFRIPAHVPTYATLSNIYKDTIVVNRSFLLRYCVSFSKTSRNILTIRNGKNTRENIYYYLFIEELCIIIKRRIRQITTIAPLDYRSRRSMKSLLTDKVE